MLVCARAHVRAGARVHQTKTHIFFSCFPSYLPSSHCLDGAHQFCHTSWLGSKFQGSACLCLSGARIIDVCQVCFLNYYYYFMCSNAVSAHMCAHHVDAMLRQGRKGGTRVPGVGLREGWVPVRNGTWILCKSSPCC